MGIFGFFKTLVSLVTVLVLMFVYGSYHGIRSYFLTEEGLYLALYAWFAITWRNSMISQEVHDWTVGGQPATLITGDNQYKNKNILTMLAGLSCKDFALVVVIIG